MDRPMGADVSIVMPAYNEAATIQAAMARVLEQPFVRELIVVDDGSADRTSDLAREIDDPRVRVEMHVVNQGKGAALGARASPWPRATTLRSRMRTSSTTLPTCWACSGPLRDGRADVVYGSRFSGSSEHRVLYYWHSVGNKFLTMLSNMATNINLTDMETCYKVFRREVIQAIEIEEDGFGFEPEVTAKVAGMGCRIYEIGVSYSGRTYAEGKKINYKDGFRAIYAIGKYSRQARKTYRGQIPGR